MRWYPNHRQEWIAETLRVFGHIRRVHLVRKFGISFPCASTDLRTYQENNRGAIVYDKTRKRYKRVSP